MVLTALGILIIALVAFIGYHGRKLYIEEQDRITKQEAARVRFITDMERAGVTFPPLDTSGHIYHVKYNGQLLTLEEWEEEPHQFSSYVSNHPYKHSKAPVSIDNQLNLFD